MAEPASLSNTSSVRRRSRARIALADEIVRNALTQLAQGRPVLLTGADGRHGDLLAAADQMTPELMAFLVRHSSGFICTALDQERADTLGIPPQVAHNQSRRGTPFGVTVDAADGVGTGISARDRARTVRLLADDSAQPRDFTRPGHMVTLRVRPGGVLARRGHAEAAVDLVRLAGGAPVAVLADLVLDDDSTRAAAAGPRARALVDTAVESRRLAAFLETHDICSVSVDELIAYRRRNDTLVERAVATRVPTAWGTFTAVGYRGLLDGLEHVAFVHGEVSTRAERIGIVVHRDSVIGDVIDLDAKCAQQARVGRSMSAELAAAARSGNAVVIYLRSTNHSATGIVSTLQQLFANENGAHQLPVDQEGADTALLARQILDDLDVHRVRLIFSDPALQAELFALGVEVEPST